VYSLLPLTEAALVGLSLATIASFFRLFSTGAFFPQLALVALVAHGTSIAARRLGWSIPQAMAASIVTMAVTVGIVLYGHTTIVGIPTTSTWHEATADLGDVWNLFEAVRAPTPVATPFLLVAALGIWWAAFVADWAAFRLWVPFEAVLPAGTVFVFSSLFASQRGQIGASALFLLATFAFLLLHRVTRQQSASGWVSSDVQRGTNALLRVGSGLALGAVVVALVVGPNLPQAHSDALVGWRNGEGDGPSSRTTVSPFVEIKKRLVDQSNLELFTVQSSQRAYWRLTALDHFDGNVWSSSGSYDKASGSLPTELPPDVSTFLVDQHFAISALDTIWLPAAYEPRSVDAGHTSVRYEPESGTLIVGTDLPNSNGVSYTVQSAVPLFDPNQLSASTGPPPPEIQRTETQLPATLDPRVHAEAERVVAEAGATTPYAEALALQDYFRNNFTYDLNVPAGQDDNAIVTFLFESKRGYCEQFAGTFAAMARSLGLPTRVAVGFTPGEQDPNRLDLYHVKGLHAHAWPEVYITGQGWVLFEPTPTRGAPFAEQYTHVPEEQATEGGTATTAPATTAPATPSTDQAGTPTTPPRLGEDDASGGGGAGPAPSFWSRARFGGRALIGAGVLAVLGVLYAIVVPLVYAVYRRRRRQRATAPDELVRLAWQESIEALQLVGAVPARSETPAEFASRAQSAVAADGLGILADLVTAADYSVDGVDDRDAQEALALSDMVESRVRAHTTRPQRLRAALDPRPPKRRRPPAPRRRGAPAHGQLPAIEVVRLPAGAGR